MGFFEHSRKAGRMAIAAIVLTICGTLSIIQGIDDPKTIPTILDKWFVILGMVVAFYYAGKQAEPSP